MKKVPKLTRPQRRILYALRGEQVVNRETWDKFGRHDVRTRLLVRGLVHIDGYGFVRLSQKGSELLDEHERTQARL